jgi:multidrug efflux pump subunit AcrA (membrane-fusion protein)
MGKSKFNGLWIWGWKLESRAIQHIVLLSILVSVFNLALPLGIQALLTFITGGEFRWGTVSVILLVLFSTFLANRWQLQTIALAEKMEERLFLFMAHYYWKLVKKEDGLGHAHDKVKYFIEVSNIQKGYSKRLIEILSAVLQLLMGVILISFYHPFFFVLGIILLIGLTFIIWKKGKVAILQKMDVSNEKYNFYSFIQKLSNQNLSSEESLKVSQSISASYVSNKRSYFDSIWIQLKSFMFFKMCVIAIMLLLGVYLAIEQKISLGQFLAAELVIVLVVNSIEKLLFSLSSVYETMVSFEKGFAILEGHLDINDVHPEQTFKDLNIVEEETRYSYDKPIKLGALMIVLICILCLPWTQSVDANGKVISLSPDQRPQGVQSVIAGKIEKWYVQEGALVKKGDTLLFISEIKDDYFDPNLLSNTENQIKSKEGAVTNYMEKVRSLDAQVDALLNAKEIKLAQTLTKVEQAKVKIKTDSIECNLAENNLKLANDQLARFDQMYKQGLISKTEWEGRQMSVQSAQAKLNDAKNKFMIDKNELMNVFRDFKGVEAEYRDKISKAESEKYSTFSSMYDAEAQVTKLQNQFNNYDRRTGYYYITAPQDGFVVKMAKSGIGETIKEGEEVVRISPQKFEHAVEVSIDPIHAPLIHEGENVRLIFDGWPAFVISGWSQMSTGLFEGKVLAINPALQEDGKLKVWIQPSDNMQWPSQLRLGGGVKTYFLLNDVPLGYELWRILNAFPPDFYAGKQHSDIELKDNKK